MRLVPISLALLLAPTLALAEGLGPTFQRLPPPGAASGAAGSAASAAEPYPNNRAPLSPKAYVALPFGSIQARGWLAEQLRLEAHGLAAGLGGAFPDVGKDSAWLGGTGEAWERGPYYTRGLVALAYAGGDPTVKALAKPWIEWVLNSQRPDGSFGTQHPDWWPRMLTEQWLTWYQEATGDPRVIPFLTRAFAYQLQEMKDRPLWQWAIYRGADNLEPIYWLYDRTGDEKLLELARVLKSQTFDWSGLFSLGAPLTGGSFIEHRHGVNVAQGLKMPALWWEQSGDSDTRADFQKGLDLLFRFYGQPHGVFTGQEPVAPSGATVGTELCVTVEYLHSLEVALPILGDASIADRIEKAAYNALPAALKSDLMGYQYYILPNEVKCSPGPHGFETDHGTNLLFGGISGYPCCAVNQHYAWPLMSQRLFLAAPGGGLAAALYAPCEVRAKVAGGGSVTLVEETGYPFREDVTIRVKTEKPTRFPLSVRIPGWCGKAVVSVNGKAAGPSVAGTFQKLDRVWVIGDLVEIHLPMELRTTSWENHSVAVERGPLVFALKVAEEWWPLPPEAELKGYDAERFPSWEVRPKSAWNFALSVDPADPAKSLQVVEGKTASPQPFSQAGCPVMLVGRGRKVRSWGLNDLALAAPPPYSPVDISTPLEPVTLVPFASTRLRVMELPWFKP